ncbi:protein kinase [Gimesia benthica]|uniref:non-specific serine/threonine protein kinase n=1 Tax=Gimesia benthica TaxID=2608982 RepID=A0A6I6AEB1_9PLAN|nr:serine/threonine-protein kinase [Gimesia benthica]QGQ24783.1 protein kinase [Gimesia benthica]
MTDSTKTFDYSVWQRIDKLCDQYEQSKRSGKDPQISDYLKQTDSTEERQVLLRELLVFEREIKVHDENSIADLKQDYLKLFPDDSALIKDVFETSNRNSLENSEPKQQQSKQGLLSAGQTIGNYELLEVLGQGGMGVVYKARHQLLKRDVALKVTRSGNLASQEEIERFLLEAHTAGKINHSGVVTVHEVGVVSDQYFIAMSLVDGQSLADIVHEGPLENRRVVDICVEIADAICAIHENGIIHRDLKPANVLIDQEGHAHITDFGLARLVKNDSNITATGQILGTPSFMAPEQASGRTHDIDERTDVYAMGAVLYCLLTGRPPFQAVTLPETLRLVLENPPIRPNLLNPQVDRDLETICLKCLEKNPDQRYQTAAYLLSDLRACSEGRPISARPLSATVKTWRWIKRKPVQSALIASLLLLILSVVTVISFRNRILITTKLQKNAEELAQSNKRLAGTRKFYGDVQKIQNEMATRKPGWTWRCRDSIESLDVIEDADQSGYLLRTAALAASAAFDFKPLRSFPVPGNRVPGENKAAGCVSFSPDGSLLAFGELINGLGPSIAIYSCEDFDQPPRILEWSTMLSSLMKVLQSEKKRSDGFRSLSFSPDNHYLAAGTRFGKVIVFDLTQSNKKPLELQVRDGVEITRVDFSNDGQHLYAVGNHKIIKEWECFEEKSFQEMDVIDMSVNPSQDMIVWHQHGEFHLRTQLSGKEIYYHPEADIRQRLPNTTFLSLSPDGKRLAVAASDHFVYETRSGRQMGRLTKTNSERHSRLKGSPEFSPDGFYLAQALEDQIVFWESDSGALIQKLPIPNALISFDPLGRYFVASDDSQVRVYELNRYQRVLVHQISDGESPAIAMGANSTLGIGRSVFHHHNWATFVEESTSEHGAIRDEYAVNIQSRYTPWVAMSPDGRHSVMSTSCLGAIVSQKNGKGWKRTFLPHLLGPAIQFEASPDQTASSSPDGTLPQNVLTAINVNQQSTKASKTEFELPVNQIGSGVKSVFPVIEVVLSNDESRGGKLDFRNPHFGAIEDSLIAGRFLSSKFPNLLCFNMKKRDDLHAIGEISLSGLTQQASPHTKVRSLSLVKSATDEIRHWDETQLGPFSYSPDSQVLWGIVNEENLWSWDSETLKVRTKWPSLMQHTVLLDIDAGKKWVATCSRNGSVQFSDVATGQYSPDLASALRPGKAIRNVNLSSDETWCLTSGDAGILERISVEYGNVLQVIHQQDDPYTAQCLSVDDRLIVTGDQSGVCRIWILHEGKYQPLVELPKFRAPVADLCLTPSGSQLAITVMNQSCIYLLDINHVIENFQAMRLLKHEQK